MEDRRRPIHRTLVVVDIEGFGHPCRTDAHQVAVRGGLYSVMREAFDQAGVCSGRLRF